MTATVTTRQTSSVSIANMPSMTEVSDNTAVLKRTLSGLQIARLAVNSQGSPNN
jgi:hypothetical protein